ncbi:hypothetical protein HK096_009000 [Nowakowskiella sp. JEL0078]|nr:hypothetical protein HK096_009000 [Nowakowskiella sp. JEL0078]
MELAALFETVKDSVGRNAQWVSKYMYGTSVVYLELRTYPFVLGLSQLKSKVDSLSRTEQYSLYSKIWELGKMHDPRITGWQWGEEHVFDDLERLTAAMHRLGFFGIDLESLYSIECMLFSFGEGGLGAQYFSLGEKLGIDPEPGWIGYINGMGVATLDHAGTDASIFSNRFLHGKNVHVVYNPTHQNGTPYGFFRDVLRMKAVDSGSCSKQSYLIAQQWIDFLNANPDKKWLQIAHSEGATHLNGALRLLTQITDGYKYINRIRVLNFCPAHFILPITYPGLQIVNFVKMEDKVINPWGTGVSKIGYKSTDHIRIVPHVFHSDDHNDPHDCLSWDFVNAAKSYVQLFFDSGNIL